MTMKEQEGFSLIELLIVVAIILIIAAIAIPNFIRARIAANEASAIASVRTISTAQTSYYQAFPSIGFAKLAELGGAPPCTASSTTACLIDETLASGVKSGYAFKSDPDTSLTPSVTYATNADPLSASTGTRHFFSDQPGVIRYNLTTSAGISDPAVN
jgi:type IV pilus assembly protein PilA